MSEFKEGDVVVEIGNRQKWVIMDVEATHYDILEIRLVGLGEYYPPAIIDKKECEDSFIKVGTWDDPGHMEAEDEE